MRRTKEKYIIALLLSLVPLVGAFLYCLLQGHGIQSLFLPDSNWNDELVYYKMTEAILDQGYPRGYFGFNESHAQMLSFAAWSPVILLQWVLWGAIFGWTFLSPYLSNIVTMGICLFVFALLVRPSRKQTVWIALMLLAFKPVSRYNLSCVPEPEMFSLMILYLGICIHIGREKNHKYPVKRLCALYVIVALMTLIRPYMILLFLTPAVLWMWKLKENKKKTSVAAGIPMAVSFLVAGLVLVLYALIGKYLSAPYLEPLFSMDWLKGFRDAGFAGGTRQLFAILRKALGEMYGLIKAVLVRNTYFAAGLYYIHIMAVILLGAVYFIADIRMRKRENSEHTENSIDYLLLFQLLLAGAAFLAADLLMYRIEPGGRHTLVFILGLLLLFAVKEETKTSKKKLSPALVMLGMTVVLYLFLGRIAYEYDLPYDDGTRKAELTQLAETLEQTIELTGEKPSFDNTVIWTFGSENYTFAEYYALPTGSGINLVEQNVVLQKLGQTESKYIGTAKGSSLEQILSQGNYTFCGGTDRIVFYKIR